MASSGTISLSIITKYRFAERQKLVMVAGHTRIKHEAVIEAADLNLRTIKQVQVMPFFTGATHSPQFVYGSVDGVGSLSNKVTIASFRGTTNPFVGGVGTCHLGTRVGGTLKIGFLAIGA